MAFVLYSNFATTKSHLNYEVVVKSNEVVKVHSGTFCAQPHCLVVYNIFYYVFSLFRHCLRYLVKRVVDSSSDEESLTGTDSHSCSTPIPEDQKGQYVRLLPNRSESMFIFESSLMF